jgi:hypothetical protein
MRNLIVLLSFIATSTCAQDRALHILVGSSVGLLAKENKLELSPRPGFLLGLEYWAKNKKGNYWSAGTCYTAFRRVKDEQKETYEYLNVYGLPMMWALDKKDRWFFQAGLFSNILLSQNLDDNGNVVNNTKKLQRIYLGPSVGLGARLGQEGRSKILLGLRNDYGVIGFGNGTAQRFNIICLVAGIEI